VIVPPDGSSPDLPIAEVGCYIRIIILTFFLGDTCPGLKDQIESVPFETKICRNPIPTPRKRFTTPIGLMVDANLNKTALQPQKVYIHRISEEEFGLVICFSKRRGELGVVDLPQGELCVCSP